MRFLSKWFSGSDRETEQIVEAATKLDGAIVTSEETGETFEIEVLPQMSLEELISLCEKLKRERKN